MSTTYSQKKNRRAILYTDGSCYAAHPDKLGGWGARLEVWDDTNGEDKCILVKEARKGYCYTTISRMEMLGIIHGLDLPSSSSKRHTPIYIVSDSQFIVNYMNGDMLYEDAENGFDRLANKDLWIQLVVRLSAYCDNKVVFIHTRGHEKEIIHHWAIEGNKRADELADYKTQKDYEVDYDSKYAKL